MRVKRAGSARRRRTRSAPSPTSRRATRIRFYIDGRYYALKDLARLALGRIAHEEGRDDDAFYHYFLIPSDSKKLRRRALRGGLVVAGAQGVRPRRAARRRVLEALRHDAARVRGAPACCATLQVKTCRFADAEKGFDRALAEYEPLTRYVDRALADPATRRALAERLLVAPTSCTRSTPTTPTASSRRCCEVDARFYPAARDRARAGDARRPTSITSRTDWKRLGDRVAADQGAGGAPAATVDVPLLLERVERARRRGGARAQGRRRQRRGARSRWRRSRRGAHELAGQLERMLDMEQSAGVRRSLGPRRAWCTPIAWPPTSCARARRRWRGSIDAASGELIRAGARSICASSSTACCARRASARSTRSSGRSASSSGRSRIWRPGRFPAEMFGKLHIEGLIGDDEEYWPPETERWADEYENYK